MNFNQNTYDSHKSDMDATEFEAGRKLAGYIENEFNLSKKELFKYIMAFLPEATNLQLIEEIERIKVARARHLYIKMKNISESNVEDKLCTQSNKFLKS